MIRLGSTLRKADYTVLMQNSTKSCAPDFLPVPGFRILNIFSPYILLFNIQTDLMAKVHVNLFFLCVLWDSILLKL